MHVTVYATNFNHYDLDLAQHFRHVDDVQEHVAGVWEHDPEEGDLGHIVAMMPNDSQDIENECQVNQDTVDHVESMLKNSFPGLGHLVAIAHTHPGKIRPKPTNDDYQSLPDAVDGCVVCVESAKSKWYDRNGTIEVENIADLGFPGDTVKPSETAVEATDQEWAEAHRVSGVDSELAFVDEEKYDEEGEVDAGAFNEMWDEATPVAQDENVQR